MDHDKISFGAAGRAGTMTIYFLRSQLPAGHIAFWPSAGAGPRSGPDLDPKMDQKMTSFGEATMSKTPRKQRVWKLFGASKESHFRVQFGTPPNWVLSGNLIKIQQELSKIDLGIPRPAGHLG